MLNKVLWPLSFIYLLIVKARYFLYNIGLLPRKSVSIPTLSVGNIVTGGAGKTPCVLSLIDIFKQEGKKVAIVYRGYKRLSKDKILEVQLDSKAVEVGDEAYLVKYLHPDVAVYVGANRVNVIKELLKKYKDLDCVLLDDAFQHLALKRDHDLVLLDASEKSRNYHLLPYGRMREPWQALNRADSIVVSKTNLAGPALDKVYKKINSLGKKIDFSFSYEIEGFLCLEDWKKKRFKAYQELEKDKAYYFISGLAKPKQVLESLKKRLGKNIKDLNYSDHYNFKKENFKNLSSKVLITEKDAVKIKDLDVENSNFFVIRAKVLWSDGGNGLAKIIRSLSS